MFGKLSSWEKKDFLSEITRKTQKDLSNSGSIVSLSTCTGVGHKTRWVVIFCAGQEDPAAQIQFLNERSE